MTTYLDIKNGNHKGKKRYYYYESYKTSEEAAKEAKYRKKRNKCQYWVKKPKGLNRKYKLYLTKCIKL